MNPVPIDRRTALLLVREFVNRIEEKASPHPAEVEGQHAPQFDMLVALLANDVSVEQQAIRDVELSDETEEEILGEAVDALRRILATSPPDQGCRN